VFVLAYVLVSLACFVLIAVSGLKLAALVKGAIEVRKNLADGADHGEGPFLKSPLVPAIAVIAAPPDASTGSREYVRRLLALQASNVEVVVVLDDPSEADRAVWIEEFGLAPCFRVPGQALQTSPVRALYAAHAPCRLIVVEKERGGVADCLNAAINASDAPLIAVVEREARFSNRALTSLLRPLMAFSDETIGVCGAAPVPLQSSGLAARIHQIEFLQSRFLKCAALSAWNALLPPTGSVVLLRRDALIGIQGVTGSLLETVVHLHGFSRATKRPYRIRFVAQPVSSPRLPETWAERAALLRRDRSGVRATLSRYGNLSMGFGSLGWLAIPLLFWELYLEPWVTAIGTVVALTATALGFMDPALLGILLAASIGLPILLSMTTVLLEAYAAGSETDAWKFASLLLCSVPENLGCRQFRDIQLMRDSLRPRAS